MSVRPATFFNFAASHSELLTALFHHGESIAQGELMALIERHGGDDAPAISYQFDQLCKLRVLELSPAGDATWQLTFPVKELLGFLLRQQVLTSTAIINAYIAEMDNLAGDLEIAATDSDADRVWRALSDLQAPLERLRNDSANNRDRLTTEALEIKGRADRTSARARFERINHLWNRYLVPLREVLDTDATMDATLDRLGRALASARRVFAAQTSIDQGLVHARRTLARLRRSVFSDHEESVREVEPLYHQLRRDTRLSRGASRALETIRAEGWATLPVEDWLALPKRERSPRFSDTAIEAFLHGMRGYSPARPPALGDGTDEAAPARIDRQELVARLRDQAPVDDVLAWLTRHYGDQGAAQVLRAYGWFHAGEFGPTRQQPDAPARDYSLPDIVLHAHPLTLTEAL